MVFNYVQEKIFFLSINEKLKAVAYVVLFSKNMSAKNYAGYVYKNKLVWVG